MTLHISSVFTYDEDAGNYIQAVETADGQALESATRKAINNFVIGCKQDGIWDAIKASCILSGARTLAGALVPLVGAAPTNYNFVAGDYDRKTGLVGDGSTKYLNSNRAGNADVQNNMHATTYVSVEDTGSGKIYLGTKSGSVGATNFGKNTTTSLFFRSRASSVVASDLSAPGLLGVSRFLSSSFEYRSSKSSKTFFAASESPDPTNYAIFAFNNPASFSTGRIAFYSIGEALDLAKLDGRVTDLINAFGAAIP